jgi:uncharacterized protein YqeY
MDTKQKLEAALKEAMRSNDALRKRTIRLALSSIKLAEIDGGRPLDENHQIAILQKELKTREESIESARTGGRDVLIETAQAEMDVLKELMPVQFSDDDIRNMVLLAIEESAATVPADMGKVMKLVLPKIRGRASSSRVSEMVKTLLNERL